MRIGFYQFRPLFGRPVANTKKIVEALRGVDADLIVLPELALSGYYFCDAAEVYRFAEDPLHSNCMQSLHALCCEGNFHLVVGFAEKAGDKCFNSAALIGPAGIVHIYRKLHLFNQEKQYFSEGDIPLQVHTVCGVKIGMMICFDWVFPEVARTLALQGAALLCHPSNLVLGFCQQTMLARCLENRVFACTANRFGADRRPHGVLKFTGKSQVVSPGGGLIYRAPAQREIVHIVEIDPAEAADKYLTTHNDIIADRRPAFYSDVAEV